MAYKIGIIGGTGLYNFELFEDTEDLKMLTAYGDIEMKKGIICGNEVYFVARHGRGHSVPPHRINYRAIILGLQEVGVELVLATAASGSLREELKPGDLVLLDQFLDFTKSRVQTFFEGGEKGVLHIDLTEPYCKELRLTLQQSAKKLNIPLHQQGTYVCTEGPRFETSAEIKMFQTLGGDLVGMTGVPEVILAREANLCYAGIGLVTNYAAGITGEPLTHQEVLDVMAENTKKIQKLLLEFLTLPYTKRACNCAAASDELGSLKGGT